MIDYRSSTVEKTSSPRKGDDSNYYSVGSSEDQVISNSSLSWINPEEGGYPKKFLDGMDNNLDREETPSLEKGTLIHRYAENKDDFVIEMLNKPKPAIAALVEQFHRNYISYDVESSPDVFLEEDIKVASGYKTLISSVLKHSNYTKKQLFHIVRCLRLARKETAYQANYKEETVIKTIVQEGMEYFHFLFDSNGKIILTEDTKYKIVSIIRSMTTNPSVNHYVNMTPIINDDIEIYKELEVYFNNWDLKCKAKIDLLIVDHKEKTVTIIDYKTYGAGSIFNRFAPINSLAFNESAIYYRNIDRQIAFYFYAILAKKPFEKNITGYKVESKLIAMETREPFDCAVFVINREILKSGMKKIESLVNRINFHKENGWDKTMEVMLNQEIRL